MKTTILDYDSYWERMKKLALSKNENGIRGMCIDLGYDVQIFRNRKTKHIYPSIIDLITISDYLDTTVDYLITGAEKNIYQQRINELESKFNQIKSIISQ